jgi:1-deoxy-D-xylulose-5-phosphate reductoisomerase
VSARRTLAVLGSTGSIGVQTLDVAEREAERLDVVALAAGRSLDTLTAQVARWQPRFVALEHAADPAQARERLQAAGGERGHRGGRGRGGASRRALRQ